MRNFIQALVNYISVIEFLIVLEILSAKIRQYF
jgi:hypothetical protein